MRVFDCFGQAFPLPGQNQELSPGGIAWGLIGLLDHLPGSFPVIFRTAGPGGLLFCQEMPLI